MTPDQFEVVTALTIGSIATIILLYLIVLKKKGWLTEEKPSGTSYLCPNQECRKIFEKPITLTDLSTNPPRGYLACPHCGLDLQKISTIRPEKSKTEHNILPSKMLQKTSESLAVRTESSKLETPTGMKTTKKQEDVKPAFPAEAPKGLTKPTESPESKSLVQASSKPADTSKKSVEAKVSERPRACPHYFGYVKTLPKNSSIPDECLWCPMIVKCLTGTEKIEA